MASVCRVSSMRDEDEVALVAMVIGRHERQMTFTMYDLIILQCISYD